MKLFTAFTPVVFGIVSIMQLIRVLKGWTLIVDGYTVPLWVSGAAFIFATCMAIGVWREN